MRNAECGMRNQQRDIFGMREFVDDFKVRTKQLGLRVIRLVGSLPRNPTNDVIGRQLLKSATSVGANYRAACRARSQAEFCAKLGIVEEEADETIYWLEVLVEAGILESNRVEDLMKEASEVLAVVVSSINTAKGKRRS